MASFKNVSNSAVIIAKHTILPSTVFTDEKYTEKEKASIQKFIRLGYFASIEEEKTVEEIKPVEEIATTPVVDETPAKKKSHKNRG